MRDALVNLHEAIEERVTANGHDTKPSSTAVDERYVVHEGRICERRFDRNGERMEPLCNFDARIVEQHLRDDGTERDEHLLLIGGTLVTGEPLPTATVEAKDFPAMGWIIPAWGARAVVGAGIGTRDRLREAMQLLSTPTTRRVYAHVGWTKVDSAHAYLHAGGAITTHGMRTDVCVEPGGQMAATERERLQRFRLRLPKDDEERRAACRASLALLDLGPKHVTVPVFAMTYLAPLRPFVSLRFTGYQYGQTGAFKTSLAALGQAHYGDFSLDCLPLNFDVGTRVGVEIVLFTLKDALVVADDFLRNGTRAEVAKRRALLNHIIRAVANQSSGARGTKNLTLRRELPPRGLPLVTAETKEVGQSTNARVLFSHVRVGDLPREKIVAAGSEANRRLLPLAMGAYVQWIAQNWKALADTLPQRLEELTGEFVRHASHSRQPGNAALVMVGMETAVAFMLEVGAIEPEAALARSAEARKALIELTIEQGEALREEDPARIFVQLLRSSVQQGRGYFETIEGGDPTNASALGWLKQPRHDQTEGSWTKLVRPKTERIGFVDEEKQRLFLDEGAALQLVHRLYRETRHGDFPVDASTLWATMAERRWLDVTEEKDDDGRIVRRPRVRQRIPALGHDTARGSRRPWVISLRMDVFDGGDSGDTTFSSESSMLGGGDGCPHHGEKTCAPKHADARVIDGIFDYCVETDTRLKVEDGRLVILGDPPDGLEARIKYYQADIIARLTDHYGGQFPPGATA